MRGCCERDGGLVDDSVFGPFSCTLSPSPPKNDVYVFDEAASGKGPADIGIV